MGGSPTNYPVQNNPAKEAATYARLEKQGMSDQGITAPEQIIPALKSFGSDLKKGVEKKLGIAPAIKAEDMVVVPEMPRGIAASFKDIPYAELDPKYATTIKGMISPSGIQQNTTLDKLRFGRDFKTRTLDSYNDIDSGLGK